MSKVLTVYGKAWGVYGTAGLRVYRSKGLRLRVQASMEAKDLRPRGLYTLRPVRPSI